jgi:ABC-type glutathione transport system ATPase component
VSPVLEAVAVSKSYGGGPPAVSEVTLEVDRGECVGVAGESGSGKTTLARCLAGTCAPTGGEVRYHGVVVNAPGMRHARVPRVRGVHMVFQEPAASLNPHRTVGSVLREILAVHHLSPKAQRGDVVAALLAEVGLSPDLAERRPSRLSGGQQQRVAIARALAFSPEVIIADEVVSALDASIQAQILNLLADLRERRGLAMILITHDLAVVRQACDRLAVMRQAAVVEQGPAGEVLDRPCHPYTRALVAAVPRLPSPAKLGVGP